MLKNISGEKFLIHSYDFPLQANRRFLDYFLHIACLI